MSIRFIIGTAYCNRYVCDKDGYVLEFSNGLKENPESESRKTWQITGAWFYVGFGRIQCITLDQLVIASNKTLKNGKPQYGLTDIDHNTSRLHGNKNVHGVAYAYKCEQ